MSWTDDLFGPQIDDPLDPWPQLAAIDRELATPRAPAMQAGLGIPAETVDAAAATSAVVDEPAPPPYAIAPHDGPAALPPPVEQPAPMQPGLGIPVGTFDALPPEQLEPEPIDMPIEQVGDIDMPVEYIDPLENPNQDQAVADLTAMDPVAYAGLKAKRDAAQHEQFSTRLLEEAQRDRERLEGNERARLESIKVAKQQAAEVEADAKELANEKLDSDRWWNNRSTGQKIAGFIAAIVGGLVQSRKGGQNEGLAFIERAIDQDIEEQKFNLTSRRAEIGRRQGVVSEMFARSNDEHRAAETSRMAAREAVIRQLEAEQQNYDPRGTTALRIADAIQDARGKQAAAMAAYEATVQTNFREDYKLLQKDREFAEQVRKNKAAERRAAAAGAGSRADNVVLTPQQLAQLHGTNRVPPIPMSQKQYKEWLETQDKIGNIARAEVTTANQQVEGEIKQSEARLAKSGAGGSPYAIGDQEGNAFRQKDGTLFEVKNDKRRDRIDEVNAAAQNIRRIADLVKLLRAKDGGASAAVGSKEYQELVALASATDFETYKAFGLGAPSAGDRALAENARGGKDITSFIYDSELGFDSYAKNIESKLNTEMKIAGYTGDPVKLKSVEAAQALERTPMQNLDVYDAPEITDAPDPAIRKRAATRANEALPSVAKGATTDFLVAMAAKNEARLKAGLLDASEAEEARKVLRREYGKKAKQEAQALFQASRNDNRVKLPDDPYFLQLTTGVGKLPDEEIDRRLGITKKDEK